MSLKAILFAQQYRNLKSTRGIFFSCPMAERLMKPVYFQNMKPTFLGINKFQLKLQMDQRWLPSGITMRYYLADMGIWMPQAMISPFVTSVIGFYLMALFLSSRQILFPGLFWSVNVKEFLCIVVNSLLD